MSAMTEIEAVRRVLNLDPDDKAAVLTRVRENGLCLRLASERLRGDPTVVFIAVRQCGLAFEAASAELQRSRDLVHLATLSGNVLAFAAYFSNDTELATAAVRRNGLALQGASPQLRNSRELVLAAMRSDARALRFASRELQQDRTLWLEAAARGVRLAELPHEARQDRDVVVAAVANGRDEFLYASPQLRADPEIALAALSRNSGLWRCVSKKLRSDPKMMFTALRKNPSNSEHLALQGEERELVLGAAGSKLAERGEEGAPVVIAELTSSERAIQCSANFMSGRSIELSLDETASVGDLAAKVVSNKPEAMKAFERICLVIEDQTKEGDEGGTTMTPWDFGRGLREFLRVKRARKA